MKLPLYTAILFINIKYNYMTYVHIKHDLHLKYPKNLGCAMKIRNLTVLQ